ncbi:MAG: TonB-dependent receptor [Chloroherpetonaceae bacterium]|nr:TonB-dependent receptor [Chloroherpetonaceae bacterium]
MNLTANSLISNKISSQKSSLTPSFSLLPQIILILLTACIAFQTLSAQEKVKLTGKITDKDNGEELIGATVLVVGTTTGGKTNVDGVFNLMLPEGTYDLKVSYIGYKQSLIKGVVVKAGVLNRQDIRLATETVNTEEIVVQADVSGATEGALLAQQRKALTVQDGVSAEQMKRTPDSDAAEASKRITGVTVMGGKYVYVRGLGERYSSTQLNGVNIPSPEPEKKTVPFDIIPSSLIENLVTIKTFLPDQPGNFAGGLVKIKTKEFPDEFQLSVGSSVGYNTLTHFQVRPNYPGSGTDFLAFDDGLRALPSGLPSINELKSSATVGNARGDVLRLFNNGVYSPRSGNYGLNQSYNLSVGDQYQLGLFPLGFIASLSYNNDASYRNTSLFFPNPDFDEDIGKFRYRYNTDISMFTVNIGGIMHFNLRLSDNNKLGLKATYNRSAEDETRIAFGRDNLFDPSQDVRSTRLRFVTRELSSTQLTGNHFVTDLLGQPEIDWTFQYATAKRDEPDNRESLYSGSIEENFFSMQNFRNQRFFGLLDDKQFDAIWNISFSFTQWDGLKSKLKVGGLYSQKDRDFSARRFSFRAARFSNIINVQPDALFIPERVANGDIEFLDDTNPSDSYTANEKTTAGYFMVELPIIANLKFVGGIRFENNFLEANAIRGSFVQPVPVNGGFDQTNILPSVNLIYSIGESINLRASFSQTVAQPEMREIAPFQFDDYISSTLGNPFLVQTTIQNFDLRAELFQGFGEMVAVSFFYKDLNNPLERIVLDDIGTNLFFTTVNAIEAKNYGAEFEFRKKLNFIADFLDPLTLGANVTIVQSTIKPPETLVLYNESQGQQISQAPEAVKKERPLQGQSPYVVNLNLSYSDPQSGFNASLLYNVFGRRISQLTGVRNLTDNVEEMPRNQVDISISQQFFNSLTVKFSAKNILNDRYLFVIGEAWAERYFVGRTFGIALSFNM